MVSANGRLVNGTLSKGSWVLVAFVLLLVLLPLPNRASWRVGGILVLLTVYALYVLALEVSSRLFSSAYDRPAFRVVRIVVNVVAVSAFVYLSRGAGSYFWALYSLPVIQAVIYLRGRGTTLLMIAILVSYWLACLASGTADVLADYTLIAINCLILLLLSVALHRLYRAAKESRQIEYEMVESLRQIALDISSQVDQESLLKMTIERAVALLKAKGGGIYEYDDDREELTVIADWGGKQSIVGHRLKKGMGMAGRVAEGGEAMTVADYGTWPHRCPDLEPDLFHAVVEVPLVRQGRIIGVLYVTHDEKGRTFTERDKTLLNLLANHAAVVIGNVKAFEESKRNITQLELLNRISSAISSAGTLDEILQIILNEALETVGTRDGSIMIFDPKTGELEIKAWMVEGKLRNSALHKRFNPGQGIAGHVAATLQPYNCRDADEDDIYTPSHTGRRLRSILSVPIVSDDNLLCIINADSLERNKFKDDDLERFSIIASHVATAIESVRLREVGVSLSSLPAEELYSKIVESAFTLIGADATALFVKDESGEVVRVSAYPPAKGDGRGVARPDGLTMHVLKTGEQVTIPDAQNDERVKPRSREQGVKSLIGVPVTAQLSKGGDFERRTIGVLFASTRMSRTFGPREVQLLYSLANQAAVAIMQARLYNEVLLERDSLKKSLGFKESLLASAIDAVIAIDRDSNITEFNTSAEKTLGYSRREVLGKNVAFLYAQEENARDIMQRLLDVKNKGRLIDYYTYARAKSGEVVPIRLSACLLGDGSVGFFRDQRAVEAIHQHNEHLRELLAAETAITELNDLPRALETTLNGALKTLNADLVILYPCDQQTGDFSSAPIRQDSDAHGLVTPSSLAPDLEGLVTSGDVHFSASAQDDELVGAEFAKAEGLHAVAAGPLKVRDKTVGVMLCGYRRPHQLSDEEQIMVRLFMGDAAIAIDHTRMYEELRGPVEVLNELHKIGLVLTTELSFDTALQRVLDKARELIGAEYGALGIKSPSGKLQPFIHSGVKEEVAKLLRPPHGHGLLGRLLREDEVINVADVSRDRHFTSFGDGPHPHITSFLGRAIIVKGKSVGNIYLGNKKGADKFSDNDENILGMLATLASSLKRVFDARDEQTAKLGITIATTLLSRLADAAKEKGAELSEVLSQIQGALPPSADRQALERVVQEIKRLDLPFLEIQKEIKKRRGERIRIDLLIYEIVGRHGARGRIVKDVNVPQAAWVWGNRWLLDMACGILIENAIRSVEKAGGDGAVSVKFEITNGLVGGTITDTGPGVAEEVLPDLFVRPTSGRAGKQGTSSYLVGMIMHVHEGYVGVKSTGPTGTEVELWLPEGRD